jgi:hypothetical protein
MLGGVRERRKKEGDVPDIRPALANVSFSAAGLIPTRRKFNISGSTTLISSFLHRIQHPRTQECSPENTTVFVLYTRPSKRLAFLILVYLELTALTNGDGLTLMVTSIV